MSHSRKKQPFAVYCGNSQKKWKQCSNRALRRIVRVQVLNADPDLPLSVLNEVSNRYDSPQDGSRHYRSFSMSRLDYRDWYRWTIAK